mgnify:CR=1 FL=1
MSDGQKAKMKAALGKLKPSTPLKFGCPNCKKSIELGRDGGLFQRQPKAETPAKAEKKGGNKTDPPKPAAKTDDGPTPINDPPDPPKPPDIGWITDGKMEEKETIEDVQRAMVLVSDDDLRAKVSEVTQRMEYQPVFPKDVAEAIKNMEFKQFAAVIFHLAFEGTSLDESTFHAHMRRMSMTKRRYIYYALIGPDLSTLYDLEALAYSANLVVNEKEAPHIDVILRKGKHDYDNLFGPLIKMLHAHGKR